jgi:hypothetical protein
LNSSGSEEKLPWWMAYTNLSRVGLVFFLQLLDLAGQILVADSEFPDSHEGAPNGDVDLNGSRAVQGTKSMAMPSWVKAYGR